MRWRRTCGGRSDNQWSRQFATMAPPPKPLAAWGGVKPPPPLMSGDYRAIIARHRHHRRPWQAIAHEPRSGVLDADKDRPAVG